MKISVIIPILNEEKSIGPVLDALPRQRLHEVIVVDAGSKDKSLEIARSRRVKVVHGNRPGYGLACLTGISALTNPEIVVFLDGDFSDYPEEIDLLTEPIVRGEADFIMGSRLLGQPEPNSISLHTRLRNRLLCFLVLCLYRRRYTDVGPFRAIRYEALKGLKMRNRVSGWNVEMQVKAAKARLRILEVPVRYRKRIGESKLSRTSLGSFRISLGSFWVLLRNLF